MKHLIKNRTGEIIALKISKFEVVAKYYVGYGANLRKLRGVKNKKFQVLAPRKERAIMIVEEQSKLRQGLSTGWIFSAKRIKY